MKFAILSLAMLAAASAMYVPAEHPKEGLTERELPDIVDSIQTRLKNMYSGLQTVLKLAATGVDMAAHRVDGQTIQDMADKVKDMLKNISVSTEDNDYAGKVQKMADKAKDMLASIKASLGFETKRDIDIVSVAEKIEAILDEIKNVFKTKDEKRGTIVDHAKKMQDMLDKVKQMLTNIKNIINHGHTGETEVKRGTIVDNAKKMQDMIDKVKEMLTNIKNIINHGHTGETEV